MIVYPYMATLTCASLLQSFVSNCPSKGDEEEEDASLARGGGQEAYLSTPQELPELKARDGGGDNGYSGVGGYGGGGGGYGGGGYGGGGYGGGGGRGGYGGRGAVAEVEVVTALAVDEVVLLAEAAKFVIRFVICESYSPASRFQEWLHIEHSRLVNEDLCKLKSGSVHADCQCTLLID